MNDLGERVAMVTGGASGIGLAIASALAAAGARIVLADVEETALERAADDLRAKGAEVLPLRVDVTSRESVAAARDAVLRQWGKLHILCNNAGVHAPGSVLDLTFEDWDWVVGVNLGGVINGVLTFLPHMREHGEPAWIVNTASVGGLIGMASLGPYSASKFGVVGMSEAMRMDLRETNVGVSVLCPGTVTTDLNASARNRPDNLGKSGSTTPSAGLKGMEPEEIGRQVVEGIQQGRFYLCSHAEWGPLVADRHAELDAAFPPDPDEKIVSAMRAFIRPE